MCAPDQVTEVCAENPLMMFNYTCGKCPKTPIYQVDGGDGSWVSPFKQLEWKQTCDGSDYDFTGTLKFCQEGNHTFGYRLEDDEPCGGLAPVIRVQPGKKYLLRLQNQAQTEVTNLHTHGLHISGAGNADDVLRVVHPGKCLFYNWTIPQHHFDGTMWYHSHLNGRTRKQVNGGALGFLIVDPPQNKPDYRPSWIQDSERMLLITTVRPEGGTEVSAANGKEQAIITLVANRWHHLRVAAADPAAHLHDMLFDDNCEVHAAAYDGVWRSVVPHPEASSKYTLSGANRIDFAIKCKANGGMYYDSNDSVAGDPLVVFAVGGSGDDGVLEPWEPPRPASLENLHDGKLMKNTFNAAITILGINTKLYDPEVPLATLEYGTLQQWNVRWSNFHPFHMHLYHFQIVTPGGCGYIYEEGEWFDSITSIRNNCLIRFRLLDIGGPLVVHCHKLRHEDMGVMGWLNVVNAPEYSIENMDEMSCEDYCYQEDQPKQTWLKPP